MSGAIGSCVSLHSRSNSVSDTEVGIGGTSQWKFCGINAGNTVGIFFEIVNQVSFHFILGNIFIIFLMSYLVKNNVSTKTMCLGLDVELIGCCEKRYVLKGLIFKQSTERVILTRKIIIY